MNLLRGAEFRFLLLLFLLPILAVVGMHEFLKKTIQESYEVSKKRHPFLVTCVIGNCWIKSRGVGPMVNLPQGNSRFVAYNDTLITTGVDSTMVAYLEGQKSIRVRHSAVVTLWPDMNVVEAIDEKIKQLASGKGRSRASEDLTEPKKEEKNEDAPKGVMPNEGDKNSKNTVTSSSQDSAAEVGGDLPDTDEEITLVFGNKKLRWREPYPGKNYVAKKFPADLVFSFDFLKSSGDSQDYSNLLVWELVELGEQDEFKRSLATLNLTKYNQDSTEKVSFFTHFKVPGVGRYALKGASSGASNKVVFQVIDFKNYLSILSRELDSKKSLEENKLKFEILVQ